MFSKSSLALAVCLVPLASGAAFAQAPKPSSDPNKPAVAVNPAAADAPKPAPAKPVDVKALTATGEKKYKAGDYKGALEAFDQVMAAKPTPYVARYVGLSHDQLGQVKEAVEAYDIYLATPPPAKEQKAYDEIKAKVDELKKVPGKVTLTTTPPGATVTVDGNPHAKPTPTDVTLLPGAHKLVFSAEGRENADRDVNVTFASKQEVTVELVEKAPPPPAPVAEVPPPPAEPPLMPPPAPEPRSKIPAYVTGGIAIVAAGVGTGFGIAALGKKSDFNKSPNADTADSGENAALIADMAFGVAITFGVTSLVLFLSDGGDSSADKDTKKASLPSSKKVTFTAAPFFTREGGGAGAGIRF